MNIEISPVEYRKVLNWYDADMYCKLLIIDGKSDWRLPTLEELGYIWQTENDFVGLYYWSSTEYDENKNMAWIKNMFNGYQGHYYKGSEYILRPVRSI